MSRATRPDYQAVRRDLGRAIRSRRPDCPPLETARVLLAIDRPGQPLVGLRYDGARAVYFQEPRRDAVAVRFGAEGLDDRGGRPIGNVSDDLKVERWIEKFRSYWGWCHPRFR